MYKYVLLFQKFSDSKATFQSDSPLKMCPLASFDEEDVDDGFLDLIDHEDNSEVYIRGFIP